MNKELIKKAFQLGYCYGLEKRAQSPFTESVSEGMSYVANPDSPAARRSAGVGKYSDNPDFTGRIDPATYFGQLEARLPAKHRYPYFGSGDERRQHIKDRLGANAVSGIGPAAASSLAYEGGALPHFSRDTFVNGAEAYDRPVTQADLAGLRAMQAGVNASDIRGSDAGSEDLAALAASLYRSGMINAETFRRTGKPLLRTEPDMYGLENLKRQLSDEEKAKLLQRQNIQAKAPVRPRGLKTRVV